MFMAEFLPKRNAYCLKIYLNTIVCTNHCAEFLVRVVFMEQEFDRIAKRGGAGQDEQCHACKHMGEVKREIRYLKKTR